MTLLSIADITREAMEALEKDLWVMSAMSAAFPRKPLTRWQRAQNRVRRAFRIPLIQPEFALSHVAPAAGTITIRKPARFTRPESQA